MSFKKINRIVEPPAVHWVGDGFRVHNFIPAKIPHAEISPFIMLDYNAKHYFEPSKEIRGVGTHPHRGFETVTVVYSGKVRHADSAGNTGIIDAGEVQWMTAGSGILHSEFHDQDFSQQGGYFQAVQIWVNLPAKHKMTKPKYQSITQQNKVTVALPEDSGQIEVISGEIMGTSGVVETFSPVNIFNIKLEPNKKFKFELPSTHNTIILAVTGDMVVNEAILPENNLILFDQIGNEIEISTQSEKNTALIMSGEPINEPIVAHGPFVMNTKQEILQAFQDLESGKFGFL
jgi:quercetin 2,3-dioxygenase